jgi:hypothetical protein
VQGDHLLQEHRFGTRNIFDGLAGHWLGQEANEIARMTCFERHADLAVGLEPANAGAMARARIDDHKGASVRINCHPFGRDDAHKRVIHRSVQRSPIDDQLRLVTQHVWSGFGEMLAILVAALAHHVPEQDRALARVDHVVHCRAWPIVPRRALCA